MRDNLAPVAFTPEPWTESRSATSVHAEVQDDHLSAEALAAYLDGQITPRERKGIEAHLIRCDPCLDEAIAMLRHLRRRPGPSTG